MIAIIPVAGAGVALRPHTHTQPKPLIPIAGQPMLAHIISYLHLAGITDFVFIIGYMGDKIRDFVEAEYRQKIRFEFVLQEPRMGLAHALWLCKDLIGHQPFIIQLGDTIIETDFKAFINHQGSVVGVSKVDNPRAFGIVVASADGKVISMKEKPQIPKSNLALVGLYKVVESAGFFEVISVLSNYGQFTLGAIYHLTDAFNGMIEQGVRIDLFSVAHWFDCSQKDTVLKTNRLLLDKKAEVPFEDVILDRVVLIPPVTIARQAVIRRSVIGPYVAIGEHTHISDSIIQDTIVGAYSRLETVYLNASIIGSDTLLIGRRHSLNIGDNTEIDFNS